MISATPANRATKSAKSLERGFTLLEMLIVIACLFVVIGFAASFLNGRRNTAVAADRVLGELAQRLQERKETARRLRPLTHERTTLDAFPMPPLEINFADPATTRQLVTDGVDANGDGMDDNNGATITRAVAPSSSTGLDEGSWLYGYRGSPLQLPTGWSIATSASSLGSVPLIANGQNGRGVMATRFGFDAHGRAQAALAASGALSPAPAGAATGMTVTGATNAPFWAVYAVGPGGRAVAVAVHPTGALEFWHWDGEAWQGFERRTVSAGLASATTPTPTTTFTPTATPIITVNPGEDTPLPGDTSGDPGSGPFGGPPPAGGD